MADKFNGNLVALEGSLETISTQVRLLPTSPQILILPGIQNYMIDYTDWPSPSTGIDAPIRAVHDALVTRNELAFEFLRAADPAHKRMVFLTGGTPSAHALCIRAIAQFQTDGDVTAAEVLFQDLIARGLNGLPSLARRTSPSHGIPGQPNRFSAQDAITRAMRAADALDQRTAELQLNSETDLSARRRRPRSMSLPSHDHDDLFRAESPFYVFGASHQTEDEPIRQTYLESCDGTSDQSTIRWSQRDSRTGRARTRSIHSRHRRGSVSCDTWASNRRPSLPRWDPEALPNRASDFSTDDDVGSFHHGLTAMSPASSITTFAVPARRPKSTARTASSTDGSSSGRPITQDLSLRLSFLTASGSFMSDPDSGNPFPWMETDYGRERSPSVGGSVPTDVGQTWYDGMTTPSVCESFHEPSSSLLGAGEGGDEETWTADIPFEPVLPLVEDLVVHFREGPIDTVLDSVIASFQEGRYPARPPSPPISEVSDPQAELPGTPIHQSFISDTTHRTSESTVVGELSTPPQIQPTEYDPFADEYYSWNVQKVLSSKSSIAPPTLLVSEPESAPAPDTELELVPAPRSAGSSIRTRTPSLSLSDPAAKFYDLDTATHPNPVAVQNALRSVLKSYFPPEKQTFGPLTFSPLPELWKPIFRDAETGSLRRENTAIDQILAVGARPNVRKEYVAAICEELECLGTVRGTQRSGKLDFRSLIASAMQAYTAQPLTSQTMGNPFSNAYLLATLLIPHLETYFTTQSHVRFLLIEYPDDRFETVLALQKLVGVDLMKVVQIVDSPVEPIAPFRGSAPVWRTGDSNLLSPGPFSPGALSSPGFSSPFDAVESPSRANFILTSNATSSEIATFLATIWTILLKISDAYIPLDTNPQRPSTSCSQQTQNSATWRSARNFSRPHTPISPISPPLSLRSVALRPGSSRSQRSVRSGSTVDTVRPPSGRMSKPARILGISEDVMESTWHRGVTTTRAERSERSVEEELEQEERRLMPMFLSPSPRNANNRQKALKFLGLS